MQNKGIRRNLEEYNPKPVSQKLYDRPLTADILDDNGVYNLLEVVFEDASKEYVATYKEYLKEMSEKGRTMLRGTIKAQEIFFLHSPLMIAIPIKGADVISGLQAKARAEIKAEKEKLRRRRIYENG